MEYPQVSIITACYNSASSIEATITSVLAQSYPNIQYIIVDANSNDGTAEIIGRYREKIQLWIREPDQGIADAWNKGIRAATGSIIGILNADDTYNPDTVETAVNALQANPDNGFVFGDLAIIDKNGQQQYLLKGTQNYADKILFDMPSLPHPTVFMRKKIYATCGLFDITYKTALDYEFLLRVHKQGVKGLYINHIFGAMMLGGESDINYARAHQEVARASVQHGYSPAFSRLRLYYKLLKSNVRRSLEKTGWTAVIRRYRKTFKRQYDYYGE